jgi:hypothetical protein
MHLKLPAGTLLLTVEFPLSNNFSGPGQPDLYRNTFRLEHYRLQTVYVGSCNKCVWSSLGRQNISGMEILSCSLQLERDTGLLLSHCFVYRLAGVENDDTINTKRYSKKWYTVEVGSSHRERIYIGKSKGRGFSAS